MAKRPSRVEGISRRFWFEHSSGTRLYPYRSRELGGERWAFRVAPPGTGANKNQTLIDDEDEVYRFVFSKGWSVRLCDANGKHDGLYNKDVGYSIVGTSEDGRKSPPSVADYVRVLANVKASAGARAFLVAHYYALGHKSSMEELALRTGYDSFESANLHYGRFAHAIADALPSAPSDLPGGRYANWTQSLALGNGDRTENGHFVWTLRPEVVAALEELGWANGDSTPDIKDEVVVTGTERQAIIAARRGQGLFRSRVMQYWGGRCAVTGCGLSPVLMASHIKPWADSTDAERLDGFNGLLLTPNLDRLFDRHLVTFDDEGALLVAPALSPIQRRALGVDVPLRIERLNSRHLRYLVAHRQTFFDSGRMPQATSIEAEIA